MKIFIPSMERADNQKTWNNLTPELKKQTFIVVPPKDFKTYSKHYPNVLNCPVKGIAKTRDWILDYAISKKIQYIVMLDDDLIFQRLRENKKITNCSGFEIGMAFNWLQEQLKEVAHAGFAVRFNRGESPDNVLSPHRMMHVLGYDLQRIKKEGVRFIKGVEEYHTMDDFNMTLQLLTAGLTNRVSLEWRVSPSAGNAKGGASSWRSLERHNNSAKRMVDLFPQYVRLRKKGNWSGMEGDQMYDITAFWKKALADAQNLRSSYYSSPRWSTELADCSMPVTFDQYSNCSYGCLYCFSTYTRAVGASKKDYLEKKVSPINVLKVKKIFTDPEKNQFWDYIKEKRPIQWGGLSDPFCNFERRYGTGLQVLQFLKEQNYPICFSTKSTWWLEDVRYTSLFKNQKNWNVKISIVTIDEKKVRAIEKGCPSTQSRLDAIKKVTGLNCGGATLRFRPFIIGISDPGHQDLILRAGEQGATAMSTEFFCVEGRSSILRKHLKLFSKYAGFDYWSFYKKYSLNSGYMRLNRKVKRKYIDEMEQAAREAGMRFYVSDAHFKERSDGSSCCGLPEDWNYSRGHFAQALQICKNKGEVRWKDIEDEMGFLKGVKAIYAQGNQCFQGCAEKRSKFRYFSLLDGMRWYWNNPKSGQSPYILFEGIMKPVGYDENKNLIYQYDNTRE